MRIKPPAILGAVTIAGVAWLTAACSPSLFGQGSGKALFEKRCGGCHALDRNKEGPRLAGVYGRRAASVESFGYSPALKDSDLVWNDRSLDRWLAGPDRLVPGNDMEFRLENASERHEIIAYLKESAGK